MNIPVLILEIFPMQKISWWSDTPTLITFFGGTIEGTLIKILSIKVEARQVTRIGDCIDLF